MPRSPSTSRCRSGRDRVNSARFSHLNLRRNPFGTPPPEVVPDIAVTSVRQYVDELQKDGVALQLLGESGRGKTTRLRIIQSYFTDAPFVLASPERRPAIPNARLVLYDELHFLPWIRREIGLTRPRSIALTSHRDLSTQLRRRGFEVRTIRVSGLSHHELTEIVERRLEWARAGDGPIPTVSSGLIQQLLDRNGDNVRATMDELYGDIQTLATVGELGG